MKQQQGYVLVTVLWIIAILALFATILSNHLSRAADRTVAIMQHTESARHQFAAQQWTAYLFGTQFMTPRTLSVASEEIRLKNIQNTLAVTAFPATHKVFLDGRPYQLDDLTIRLQDQRGLINPALVRASQLREALDDLGIGEDRQTQLIARLQDYTDPDDLTRLNGAESRDYERAGLDPPSGAPLTTPYELRRVMGWTDVATLLADHLVTGTNVGLNPNTATPTVLQSVPFLDEEGVARVLLYRRTNDIRNPVTFSQQAGVVIRDEPGSYIFFPALSQRLTFSAPHGLRRRVVSLTLTPASQDAPWTLDYGFDLPASSRHGDTLSTDPFPPLPVADPDR